MSKIKIRAFGYYIDKEGRHIPCIVMAIKGSKLKIRGDFLSGDKTVWIKRSNFELFEESA
jgi:hypothetical protein